MPVTSIAAICTTIKEWIDEMKTPLVVGGLTVVQNFDELTEGMNSTPGAQVYWDSIDLDSTTETVAYALQNSRRAQDLVFNVDLYTGDRNHLHLNMAATVRWADLLWDKMQEKCVCGAFGGDPAINVINIEINRVVFEYATVSYPGVRCVLTVRVF